jgi:uncharacterized protein YbjT (DUF2867 family)
MPIHRPEGKPRILVTGATGTVGKELVEQLESSGAKFRVFVRDPSRLATTGRFEISIGDLDDRDSLREALSGIEKIFLITAGTGQDRNVIELGSETGLRHIVKLSTQEAGWTPVKGHGVWHREREELIKSSGLDWTFLRPCMFMSTALSWAPMVKEKSLVKYPGGGGKIAPIHPSDVAAVAMHSLTESSSNKKGYELTGPEPLSFPDMTQILSAVIGKKLDYVDESDEEFSMDLRSMSLPEYVIDGLVQTFAYVRKGDFAHVTDTVETVTGKGPRSFESWCKEYAPFFK